MLDFAMSNAETVVVLAVAFSFVCRFVYLYVFRYRHWNSQPAAIGFALFFAVVQLTAAVYLLVEGALLWAVFTGFVGVAIPVFWLGLSKVKPA
jgi:hypothetical protein